MEERISNQDLEDLTLYIKGQFSSLNEKLDRLRYKFRESADKVLSDIRRIDYQLDKISGRLI
jgi:hypothetical protein